MSDFSPNVRPVAAFKTRVWVAQGRLGELCWAREQGLSAHDDLTYLREFEHITLVRVLLARHQQRPCRPLHAGGSGPARAPPAGSGSRGTDEKRHRNSGIAGTCLSCRMATSLRLSCRCSGP